MGGDIDERVPRAGFEDTTLPDRSYDGGDSTIEVDLTRDGDNPAALPRTVERFVVLGELGRGGMGTVVSAYDPQLDRKLAIKMVRTDVYGAGAQHAQMRLIREARAMAKVSHPNIVAIYETGSVDNQVFIAMEFVDGGTLRDWLDREPRTWQQILEKYIEAGAGLLAAHDAGLVHRDFKPANVLVDATLERARVTDFGLVGLSAELTSPNDTPPSQDSGSLTQTGAVMGTPNYMAPEQHEAEPTDARTDQFSFCVSLYEALYGELPFAGKTRIELALSVGSGEIRAAPKSSAVPRWLRDVLTRGLQSKPDDRYPSMRELLAELRRDRTSARRRGAVAAGIVALIGTTAVATWQYRGAESTEVCPDAAAMLDGVWDADRRDRIAARFAAAKEPYARYVFATFAARIDAWTREWQDARQQSCEATRVRKEQSEELFERRTLCLDRALAALGAASDVWLDTKEEDLERTAYAIASSLPPVSVCSDTELIAAADPLPDDAETRAAIQRSFAELARALALVGAERYEEAEAIATAALADAQPLGYAPLRARALSALATTKWRAGSPEAAAPLYDQALDAAIESKNDRDAAQIWLFILALTAEHRGREEALALRKPVEVALGRADDDDLRLNYAYIRANSVWESKREAAELWREVIELMEAQTPPDVRLASVYNNYASNLLVIDEYETARTYLEKSVALTTDLFSADHPRVIFPLANLGKLAYFSGDSDLAAVHFKRALDLAELTYSPEHPLVPDLLSGLAGIYLELDRLDDGRTAGTRALELFAARFGEDHPECASTLVNLGQIEVAAGNIARARETLRRALDIYIASEGRNSIDVALTRGALADAVYGSGNTREALSLIEAAMKTVATELGTADESYGELLMQRGQLRQNLEDLDRARQVYAASQGADCEPVAIIDSIAAEVRASSGDCETAGPLAHAALSTLERYHGPTHSSLVRPLRVIATCERDVEVAERARLVQSSRTGHDPVELGRAELVLADLLWATDAERARGLAVEARRRFNDAGERAAQHRAAADTWLAAHQ